ncbi:hypothetical protein QAD02_005596 [Eretmocerus hayati]|uniref:Uncharacterized protein n=1 Tax=Eretmocerus hayati TaxID=131215 RepID=A0ACC2NSV5_9HYME|nr:hypothetical protein QAD02_005596 [Eretmocerus hayati]
MKEKKVNIREFKKGLPMWFSCMGTEPDEGFAFELSNQQGQQEFKDMLGDDGILLFPTHPTAAPLHYEPLVKPFILSYTAIINLFGLPATGLNSAWTKPTRVTNRNPSCWRTVPGSRNYCSIAACKLSNVVE